MGRGTAREASGGGVFGASPLPLRQPYGLPPPHLHFVKMERDFVVIYPRDRGRPNPFSAIIERCTWLVPP